MAKMLGVIVDEKTLSNQSNAENNPVGYLFSAVVFLYDFLGKNPEYSKVFEIHSELLEGVMEHFDISPKRLTSEEVSVLLEKLRNKYESKFNELIPVSIDDEKEVFEQFSEGGKELVVAERVAFFAILRYSSKLMNFDGAREKFLSVMFYFYGKLGSYVYWLKDQNDKSVFQSKLIKALIPSRNPEDVYFEFSVAYAMKRQNVILKFVPEKEGIRTPDFDIYFDNQFIGCLECTNRRQKDKKVLEHVIDGLKIKAEQIAKSSGAIKCLAINMPSDLNLHDIQADIYRKGDVQLIYLTDKDGTPIGNSKHEVLEIAEALKSQTVFTNLLVTSDNYIQFSSDGVGWTPKRRLFQKGSEYMFPGIWPEGIIIVE